MKTKFVSALVALGVTLLTGLTASAAVYLRADSPGGADGATFDGTSWSTAYKTVDEAFTALQAKSDTLAERTLYVAKGLYTLQGSKDAKHNTFASIAVYGGYQGETDGDMTRDVKTYETIMTSTTLAKAANLAWSHLVPSRSGYATATASAGTKVIVDGKVTRPAFSDDFGALALSGSCGAEHDRFLNISASGEGAVVNGITFIAFFRTAAVLDAAAGAGAITVENCVFAGNSPQSGCVRLLNSSTSAKPSVIRDCVFYGNYMAYTVGSCLYSSDAHARIENCEFAGNYKTDGYGSGTVISGSGSVSNCVFTHNWMVYNGNNNGADKLLGTTGDWTDSIITNNLTAMKDGTEGYSPILAVTGCARNLLVANNRTLVTAADTMTYSLVGLVSVSGESFYENCLFASNTLSSVAATVSAGGAYAMGILGGRPAYKTSGVRKNGLRNCTFDGNSLEVTPVAGVTPVLSRGILVSDYPSSTGSDAQTLVTNCTFVGAFVSGVAEVAQFGISKKTSSICDSIFEVTDADVCELPFSVSDAAKVTVKNCSIRNMVAQYCPSNPDITDGLAYDPIPFERIPFTVNGAVTGWTLLRPAAKVPGIRETTDGSVRGAVNALSSVAEGGKTLVVRRSPFAGGTVDIPSQAVETGAAIAPVTATAASGGSVLGWYEEGSETPLSTAAKLELAALDADKVVTVRFGVAKVTVSFDLGSAGVFGDGNSVTNISCDAGAEFPAIPVYAPEPTRHIYAWDDRPAVVPVGGTTIHAHSVEKTLRQVYVKPGGTGDGSSWEKASGDLAAAYANAGRYRGELFVGAGDYALAAPVTALPNVTVIGDEAGGTVVSGENGNSYTYSAFASEADGVTNVVFRNVTFRDFARAAISLTGAEGDCVTVSNCVFDTCNRSKTLLGATYSALAVWYRPILCIDSFFTNNCRAVLHQTSSATTNLFANCTFVGNLDGCLALLTNAGGATRITNCVFGANTGTTYDAGSSSYPLGPCLMYSNTGSHRLDVEDSVFTGSRMAGNVYSPVYLVGESSANTVFSRCRFTDNVYSGDGARADHAGVFWLGCKSKVITVRDSYIGFNCVTSTAQKAENAKRSLSVMQIDGTLAMYVNLLNCTIEGNEAVTEVTKAAGTIANNAYSAVGMAHCVFLDNRYSGSEGCAEFINYDNWNSDLRAVNSVFWNDDATYVPFVNFGASPAVFGHCVIKNYDASVFGSALVTFGAGVWTTNAVLRAKTEEGENGVFARRLAGDSPFVRAGYDDVWYHDNKIYVRSAEVTGKENEPWQAFCDKPAKKSDAKMAEIGLTVSSPRTTDAWGRLRRAKRISVGPVNVDLGLMLIVK